MIVRVGDRVRSKHGDATIVGIEVCPAHDKYGTAVESADIEPYSSVVVDLDNGHWTYAAGIYSVIGGET